MRERIRTFDVTSTSSPIEPGHGFGGNRNFRAPNVKRETRSNCSNTGSGLLYNKNETKLKQNKEKKKEENNFHEKLYKS